MEISLTGKNALITGGTRGIGRAISLTLAGAGARIAALYRSDDEAANETLQRLSALPGNTDHFAVKADIAQETQANDAVAQAVQRLGGALDILVLDAAQAAGGRLTEMAADAWRQNFATNADGAFYIVRAAAPHIRTGGSIVFISSGAGHEPLEGLAAYGASKAAANLMAGVLAQELGPQGIRVNIVSPGHTDKSGSDPNRTPENYTESQRHIVETTALRRIGTAQDVANVVLFYVSDLSGFVTGQWLRVNGGRV